MLSEPTTTTDTNGDFMLTGLDPGNYLLLYAMPGELTSTPEHLGGVMVGPTKGDMDREENLSIQVMVNSGRMDGRTSANR